jgi:hypothetical protein
MTGIGPPVEHLTRRLAACPLDLRGALRDGEEWPVEVPAVLSDVVEDLGGAPLQRAEGDRIRWAAGPQADDLLGLQVRVAWVLDDDWFRARPGRFAVAARRLLLDGLADHAVVVRADTVVTEPDRREELVRRVLAALDLVPGGESADQAADRLRALDSAERARILRDTRAAEVRAQRVREELARQAAAEAAARYDRE